jgi:uncharacterized coiled-coil protein SlyX
VSLNLEEKLTRLEVLYSEQEHTVQVLNEVVANQNQEIGQLNSSIEQIKQQLQMLKVELAGDISSDVEIPPHY